MLDTIAEWGFLLGFDEVHMMTKKMLDGLSIVSKWKDNYPGRDWVYGYKKRDHLSSRMAGNIKQARAVENETMVKAFFKEFKEFCRVNDIPPENIMNYEETNRTDDPGKKSVLVRRGRQRVENVTDSTKTTISIMWCGSASGEVLPCCIVYKAENTYKGWTTGAPNGTHFTNSKRVVQCGYIRGMVF